MDSKKCKYCDKVCYDYSYSNPVANQNNICAKCWVAMDKIVETQYECTNCNLYHEHQLMYYNKCNNCNRCHPLWSKHYYYCTKQPIVDSPIDDKTINQYDALINNNYHHCSDCKSFHKNMNNKSYCNYCQKCFNTLNKHSIICPTKLAYVNDEDDSCTSSSNLLLATNMLLMINLLSH